MTTLFRRGLLVVCAALLAAGPAVAAKGQKEPKLNLDQEFARMAEKVPGFGGLYVDAQGTPHVYLTDLSRAREVQGLGAGVKVHLGKYDFRDLVAWKAAARDLLSRPGAVSLDIDETRNRIVLGVRRESLGPVSMGVPAFLRGARVPGGAVIVEAARPFVTQETLTDRIRPIPGGAQIQNSNGGTCSLGYNAIRLGVRGFVTASHCTLTQGGVEGTVFSQNTVSFGNLVGTEVADPALFSGGDCPSGRLCRYSDAAFVNYGAPDAQSGGGTIANPILCGFGDIPGSLTVQPADPRLEVTGFLFGTPVSGTVVRKVGRTTGCTFGSQQDTCTNVNVYKPLPLLPGYVVDTGITMLCQGRVSALSQGGDSGSPVFLQSGGSATAVGVLWGGNGSSFVYSPWLYITMELGGAMPEID